MRIAIPVADGRLALHFGHCQEFAILDVDAQEKKILGTKFVVPPPHAPGVLPQWLREQGANVIIAGGMGQRAQQLFVQNNIAVVVGAPSDTPERIVESYLAGGLQTGENLCDH